MSEPINEYEQRLAYRQQMRRRRRRLYRIRQMAVMLTAMVLLIGGVTAGIVALCHRPAKDVPPDSVPESAPPVQAVPQKPAYPVVTADTVLLGEEVDADSAVLVDLTENRIVAAKEADRQVYPASVTKVMTVLVAVEHIRDFTETYKMPFDMLNQLFIEEASVAGFSAGEAVCMTDLLYGAILPSGADATGGLARHIAGSEEGFAELMNQKAQKLGLKNTHFTNTSGLHDKEHYMTATDMAVILAEAMKDPLCRQVLGAVKYVTASTPEHPEGLELYSTMFSRMYGTEPEGATVIGGKTGYTAQAGHTMASSAVGEDGHEYIFVSMQGSNRGEATYDAIETYTRFCPTVEE